MKTRIHKKYLLCLLITTSLISTVVHAQTAQWIRQEGTTGITNGVSHDANKNCYAAGLVNDPALFDNLTVPSHFADVYIAKYNSDGIIQWAKTAGAGLIDQAYDIATDAAGNSYVTGAFQTNNQNPTVTFDNTVVTGKGSYDWFLAKYDASGNLVWVKSGGSILGDFAFGVALDLSGDIIITGTFSGTMTVDGITVVSAGLSDVFTAKFTTTGNLIWLKRAGGINNDEGQAVVTDAEGNIAIAGDFQNKATFGSNSITASGLGDAFIAKYDGSGNNLWVKKGGGNLSFVIDKANSISADAQDNFFITGEYSGDATFDNLIVGNNGSSGTDIFIAKYNSNGVIQWLHHGGGTENDKGFGIDADTSGNTFVTGFASSGPGVIFDTISLPPFGNEYVFLAKYNAAGSVLYVKQYAAGSGQDIDVLNDGCLYFGGGASKSNSGNEFDTIDLVYVDRDAFTGKFCDPIVSCGAPGGLFANKITSTSAKLHWSTVAGAVSYTVEYRKLGLINWKTKTSLTNTKKVMNLQPSTTYEYRIAAVCANGTSDFSAIQTFMTSPMRVGEITEEPELSIYPNPSEGKFTISYEGMSENSSVIIYDGNGRIIYTGKLIKEESAEINLPSSFHGLAYLTLKDENHTISKTVLIL